jgi:hypothetical protein
MHRTRPDVIEACYAIIGAVLVLASGLLVTWGALALYRKGVNTAMDEVAGRVSRYCASRDPQFQRAKFLKLCGIETGE